MQTLYKELGKYYDAIIASHINTKTEIAFLKQIFAGYSVLSVLDIGCGTGRHSIALAKEGFKVTGVDYSKELINVANTKARELSNIHFLVANVATLDLTTRFDAAICMWSTFGELPYKEMVNRLKSIIKSNGLFLIDSHYYRDIPTHQNQSFSEVTIDDISIKTEIKDNYIKKKRIREITYNINGNLVHDRSEMDILTENDYISLLEANDFIHIKTYYDYKEDNSGNANRIQLLFRTV